MNYLTVLHDALHLAEEEGARVIADLKDKVPAEVGNLLGVLLSEVPRPEPTPAPLEQVAQPTAADAVALLASLPADQRAALLAQLAGNQTPTVPTPTV